MTDSASPFLNLPRLESHSYIIEWLFDFGPGISYGMGLCPVSCQEIAAWANGIELSAWEMKTLRALSREYVSWSNKATKKDCEIPYIETANECSEQKANLISNEMLNYFKRLSENNKTGLGKIK